MSGRFRGDNWGSQRNLHNRPDTQFSSRIKTEAEEDAEYEEEQRRQASEASDANDARRAEQSPRIMPTLRPLPPRNVGYSGGKRRSKSSNKPKKSAKRAKTAKRVKSRKTCRRHK